MTTNVWFRGLAAASLSVAALATVAAAQQAGGAAPAAGGGQQQPGLLGGNAGNQGRPAAAMDLPGPIDTPQDLQDTARMAFMIADANHDGQISKKEATDAGYLLVGGFFFRADANGDGKVTQEEARAVREEILRQNPMLRLVLQQTKPKAGNNANATNPQQVVQVVANLLDANNDKQLTSAELRQAVDTVVDTLYGVADTNRDGQMSAAEVNAAALAMGRDAARLAFRMADADGNGSISREEFEKAIIEPARVVFSMADSNNDGQISADEAQRWQDYMVQRLQAAAPRGANRVGPLPDFLGSANQGGQAQPATPNRPAPAPTPAAPPR